MAYYDKVDGDAIIAGLAKQHGVAIEGEHGVMFVRGDFNYPPKFIGWVTMPTGIKVAARFFYRVAPWQENYARKLVKDLNQELYHDGAWAVLWSNPTEQGLPTQINMAWQDADGDVAFVINSDRTLADMQTNGHESHLANCEKAWIQYKDFMAEVDVQKDQTIKAAKGQIQKDPSIVPLL